MTNPLTNAREAVSSLLEFALDSSDVPVYAVPPSSYQGPFVMVHPNTPWIDNRGHIALSVTVCVAYTQNDVALERLEQLTSDVLTVIRTSGDVSWGEVLAPELDPSSNLLMAVIPVMFR